MLTGLRVDVNSTEVAAAAVQRAADVLPTLGPQPGLPIHGKLSEHVSTRLRGDELVPPVWIRSHAYTEAYSKSCVCM